ncbi:type II and III secretion system protein family protein [Sporolituus thermophilus]|uniref:Pilus assembly protein CpaC n=1 Tax=Sporolituus thermophilus DSM 23256 TaxID=1123285 RepID=A0A1G7HNI9_9FIRM|nr:pilus assembly protein N-terminal domain-containing protein [Sporolituus thermophilus]SDF02025.1 pilus assembly protein CpaC [Sporolituus thermophilus DSM 23256]
MGKSRFCAVLLISICIMLTAATALANAALTVAVNQSRVLGFNGVQRVAVANPEIADVLVVSGTEVLVVGKAPGVTTLHVWTAYGRTTYEVEVGAADAKLAGEIRSILGYDGIRVSKVNRTVILEGTVDNQYQKARAEKLAAAYGDKVVNLLEVLRPVQVKIEAKVLEINRQKLKELGIKWGNSPGTPGTFAFGQSALNSKVGDVFGDLGGYADINAQLSALVKNGAVKVLSQPNVVTLSGDKASIMIGGQIPVPVAQDNNKITIEWKDYGIKLDIAPEVNGDGLIQSRVKAEVSSLDYNSASSIKLGAGMEIPPVRLRKAETAIALSSGQTMAIGGLIATETSKDVVKVPMLGDLPVLGQLFRSTSFRRGETELLVLITPLLVNPAEYLPATTREMAEFAQENPRGGK